MLRTGAPAPGPDGHRVFEDVTPESFSVLDVPPPDNAINGIDLQFGGGGLLADLDGDGRSDLLAVQRLGGTSLFVGTEDGGFEPATLAGVDAREVASAAAADLDGDGWQDLLLGQRETVRVFFGLGGGAFREGPIPFRGQAEDRVLGFTVADADGDGAVDVFVSLYGGSVGDARPNPRPAVFLQGGPPGALTDRSDRFTPQEALIGLGMGAVWLDANVDGKLDLYALRDRGREGAPNRLFVQRDGRWVAGEVPMDDAMDAMGGTVGDPDADGRMEVAVSDTERRLLLRTVDGDGAIERQAAWGATPAHADQETSWGLRFADVDLDGHDDLVIPFGVIDPQRRPRPPERPGLLKWGQTGFLDATHALPVEASPWWRNVLPQDRDGDGRVDLVFTALFGPPVVLRNLGPERAWLEVALDGPPGNRQGLGARVTVVSDAGVVERVVAVGEGYCGSTDPIPHWGLGDAEEVDVRVDWPDGRVTEQLAVPTRQRLRVAPP